MLFPFKRGDDNYVGATSFHWKCGPYTILLNEIKVTEIQCNTTHWRWWRKSIYSSRFKTTLNSEKREHHTKKHINNPQLKISSVNEHSVSNNKTKNIDSSMSTLFAASRRVKYIHLIFNSTIKGKQYKDYRQR